MSAKAKAKNDSWSGLFGRVYDNSKSMGKTVQKSSVEYARMRVTITSIIGTIIGIGLLVFGIISLVWAGKYKSTDAKISCVVEAGKPPVQSGKKCSSKKVTLTYKGTTIPFKVSKDEDAVQDDKLKISYLKSKPKDKDSVTDNPVPWKMIGIICLVLSIVIIIGVWVQYYMVQKSEVAATATAASNAMRLFS